MNFDILFYSDFNTDLIQKFLLAKYKIKSISTNFTPQRISPFNPIEHSCENCIVWFSLESFKTTFLEENNDLSNLNKSRFDNAIQTFATQIIDLSKSFKNIIFFSFLSHRGFEKNVITNFNKNEDAYITAKLNNMLADYFSETSSIFVFDMQYIINKTIIPFDLKNWYLTKNPFSNEFTKNIADEINFSLGLINNGSKIKVIFLDLDNTIWGGEAGERKLGEIRLGGHDFIGESFVDFQKKLLALNKKGILIALVSKNEEEIAMNIFDNHPEMILKREHITKKRINWEPKYLNILSIIKELNLGLDAALFIDDNPVERESIRINLPEVNILDLPKNPFDYSKSLESCKLLYTLGTTKEDKLRTSSYKDNEKRNHSKNLSANNNLWLQGLETKVSIDKVNESNLSRYVQLLNKTNQFNARTRRLSLSEFEDWNSIDSNYAFTIRLIDKFGDLGIIGLIGFSLIKKTIFVEDFVLSCRAAGRCIENLMVYEIFKRAKSFEVEEIILKALLTQKNKPIIDFFNNNTNLCNVGDLIYQIKLNGNDIRPPEYININYENI